MAYATEIKSIQLHDSIVMASPWDGFQLHYIILQDLSRWFQREQRFLQGMDAEWGLAIICCTSGTIFLPNKVWSSLMDWVLAYENMI